ncbi:MAG TPA: sigma 54-interacting transcriptional regulator [Gemmatimonadales bacterium]|nr:sigma 54-interacting transcriptional regulator [Gemmatimonadales bacterium]
MTQSSPVSPLDFGAAGWNEHLLDLLPVAVCRWDIAGGIPTTASAEELCQTLRASSRAGYANPAHQRLLGLRREDLDHLISAVEPPGCGADINALRRFMAGAFRLERFPLRVPGADRRPRFCQASWLGVVQDERLVAIWTVLQDVTAERSLERATTIRSTENTTQIVGRSAAIGRVMEKIDQVAGTDSTVLIRGETGTGKELIARAIHQRSARRDQPLIAVNCGAIAASLVESELFGHEKGAFTGALSRKIGRFELADGGTLFLDEIGDLSLDLQVKLLRVLQEGELSRVGGSEAIRVDVRIIAATHRDLSTMVATGAFRQDLYYRLNVFPIMVPPLRDRREDIPLLVSYFAAHYAERLGKRIDTIPEPVMRQLSGFHWPGNIRELANVIERSVIVSPGSTLQLAEWATGAHVPVAMPGIPRPSDPASVAVPGAGGGLLELERRHIIATLERTRWKVSGPGGAAEILGLKPTTLEARMKKLGIVRP